MPQDTVLISHKDLRELCIRPLQGLGVPGPHAEIVADSLVDANLRGVDSHGGWHRPNYRQRFQRRDQARQGLEGI